MNGKTNIINPSEGAVGGDWETGNFEVPSYSTSTVKIPLKYNDASHGYIINIISDDFEKIYNYTSIQSGTCHLLATQINELQCNKPTSTYNVNCINYNAYNKETTKTNNFYYYVNTSNSELIFKGADIRDYMSGKYTYYIKYFETKSN